MLLDYHRNFVQCSFGKKNKICITELKKGALILKTYSKISSLMKARIKQLFLEWKLCIYFIIIFCTYWLKHFAVFLLLLDVPLNPLFLGMSLTRGLLLQEFITFSESFILSQFFCFLCSFFFFFCCQIYEFRANGLTTGDQSKVLVMRLLNLIAITMKTKNSYDFYVQLQQTLPVTIKL